METPSSVRRATRSQALAAANNSNNIPMSRKLDESEKSVSKSKQRTGKQQERSALFDMTNDSPIIGLAMKTPSSTISKKWNNSETKHKNSGSGEALLRGQAKTLLQKVEEEAELSKLSFESRPFTHHRGLMVNSPLGILEPTPDNTPQVLNLSGNGNVNSNGVSSGTVLSVQEGIMISQMVTEIFDAKKQENLLESDEGLVTRSLLLDFSEKSEGSDSSKCSSVLTYQGGESVCREKLVVTDDEDDDASIWSIQVNASSTRDEEEGLDEDGNDDDSNKDKEEGLDEDGKDDDSKEDEYDGGGLVDELCEGMSKINVNGEKVMATFTGKHTRFVYNSDDELEGEEECGGESSSSSVGSVGVLCLKGLPTPKGKHLRFPEDLEED